MWYEHFHDQCNVRLLSVFSLAPPLSHPCHTHYTPPVHINLPCSTPFTIIWKDHFYTILSSQTKYFLQNLKQNVFVTRSGVGAPVVGEIDGEYHHDNRKNILEWTLPVINSENKSGSLEFSIAGSPDDFFPVNVNFFAKRTYCNIQVCCTGG